MSKERVLWDQHAAIYDSTVFYLTKYQRIREKILSAMCRGTTLDLGCGPKGLLLDSMQQCDDLAVGTDFSPRMLAETRKFFQGSLIRADSRNMPFAHSVLDSVVSVNSILPQERKDVASMFAEVFRILRTGGKFVAYLPSYDYGTKCIQAGIQFERDEKDFREWDTDGWQCTYTREIIDNLASKTGFSHWQIEIEKFIEPEEVQDANRIYGVALGFDFSHLPIEEYFLVATK